MKKERVRKPVPKSFPRVSPLQLFLLIAVIMLVLLGVGSVVFSNYMTQTSLSDIATLADYNATTVGEYLTLMEAKASTLSEAFSQFQTTSMSQYLQDVALVRNILDRYAGTIHAFSAPTWRLSPTCSSPARPTGFPCMPIATEATSRWTSSTIMRHTTPASITPLPSKPASRMSPSLTSTSWTNGQTVWLVTMSCPVVSKDGKFMGVTNCDILCDSLNALSFKAGSYKSAYNFLLSSKNAYLSHSQDKSLMGTAFSGDFGKPVTLAKNAAKAGDALAKADITQGKNKNGTPKLYRSAPRQRERPG